MKWSESTCWILSDPHRIGCPCKASSLTSFIFITLSHSCFPADSADGSTSQLDKRLNIKQISSNSVSIWKYPKLNNFTFTGYISSWLVYGKYELFLLPGAWWRCQGHLWLLLPPASSWTIQSGQQVLSSLAFVFSSINSSSRSPCQDPAEASKMTSLS